MPGVRRITIHDNLWAEPEGVVTLVDEAISYKPAGGHFSPRAQTCRCGVRRSDHGPGHPFEAQWDGVIHMLKYNNGVPRFPAGLVPFVQECLAVQGAPVEIVDKRVESQPSVIIYSAKPQVKLDPHQEQAVADALEAKRGVIWYPTGTGKTTIMGETIRRSRLRTLVLCGTKVLLEQLTKELSRLTGAPVGKIGDGHWEDGMLVVATFQTLVKRLIPDKNLNPKERKRLREEALAYLGQFQQVIADEGHHIAAATFEECMKACTGADRRYCFSATPNKSGADARETMLRVQGWTGPVASHLTIAAGVETGRIVPTDMFVVHLNSPKPAKGTAPINFKGEVDEYVIHNERRNDVIARIARKSRRRGPTVVIVERAEHGRILASLIGCDFVSGTTTKGDRELAWSNFKRGNINCLVVSKIADEGLDLPNIHFLILAAGGKAQHRQVQRIGRGMRASEGKTHLTAFDFDDDLGQHLPRHYRSRRRLYDGEAAYTVTDLSINELEDLVA